MIAIQCWFCGGGIKRIDRRAIALNARNLWSGGASSAPNQDFFAHSECAEARLGGSEMDFDAEMLAD